MQWIWINKTKAEAGLALLLVAGCAPQRPGHLPRLDLSTTPEAAAAAPAEDPLQSIGIADPQKSALAMSGYDDVMTLGWEAVGEAGISLSHPSLPIPSYVEITRLDTGRTILARVAGRATGVATLSPAAADLLGLGTTGQQPFRVRRVNPTEQDKAALRQGVAATTRLDTPEILLVVLRKRAAALKPAEPIQTKKPLRLPDHPQEKWGASFAAVEAKSLPTTPDPSPKAQQDSGSWFVQIAALSNEQKAHALAAASGGKVSQKEGLFRVRTGPYLNRAAALGALGRIHAKGYPEARITR